MKTIKYKNFLSCFLQLDIHSYIIHYLKALTKNFDAFKNYIIVL